MSGYGLTCPDCGVGVPSVHAAVLHECGKVEEPDTAPEPATTRDLVEAIQGVALQLAAVNETCQRAAEALEESTEHQRVFVAEMQAALHYWKARWLGT